MTAAVAAAVPENPIFPQLMPAIDFQGADAGVVWNDFSPRVGVTYDLTGDGRTVISSSYATYYGQMAPGQLVEPARRHRRGVRPLSVDRHQRRPFRAAQRGQHVGAVPGQAASNYDPANPTSTASPTRVDPDVKNDRTREFIVGFDRQLGSQMAFGASYIWRKYDRFPWNDRDNWTQRELPRGAITRRPAARRVRAARP